jgi:hypothetical protein
VKPGGAALSQLLLHFRADCANGMGLDWAGPADFASFQPPTIAVGTNVFAPAKLSRTGSFKASGLGASSFGENSGILKESIRGRVRGAVAHGTFDATVDVFGPDGAKITSCRTGRLRWAARSAPGRTFGRLKASGTFQVKMSQTDAAGAITATCDSTLLRWNAASSRGPAPRRVKRQIRAAR